MAEKSRRDDFGFDVTCVIGKVEFDPAGEKSPHVAAFELIAEHEAPGEYHFPMPDGQTCSVTVRYD